MKRLLAICAPALAGILVIACSGDPDRPPATSSSGTVGAPVTGASSTSSGGTSSTSSGSTSSSTSSSSSSSGSTTSSSGATSSGGASSGGTDGGTDSGSTAPSCQGVPREGTSVGETAIAAAPPAAAGGNIAAGKYHLTLWESYTGVGGTAGPTGETRKATLVVTGTMLQFAVTDVEQAVDLPIWAEQSQTQGSTLTSDEICPLAGRPRSRSFTAAPTQLELFESVGAITRRFVYTKQ